MVKITLSNGKVYCSEVTVKKAGEVINKAIEDGDRFIIITSEDEDVAIPVNMIEEIRKADYRDNLSSKELCFLRAAAQLRFGKECLSVKPNVTITFGGVSVPDKEEIASKVMKILKEEINVSENNCY